MILWRVQALAFELVVMSLELCFLETRLKSQSVKGAWPTSILSDKKSTTCQLFIGRRSCRKKIQTFNQMNVLDPTVLCI